MNIIKYLWDNTETDKKELKRNKKLIISSMIYTIIIILVLAGLCLIFPNDVHDMDVGLILGLFIFITFIVTMIRDIFWYTNIKIKICSVLIILIISALLAYRKDGYFINVSRFAGNSFYILVILSIIERTRQYATSIIKFLTRKSK